MRSLVFLVRAIVYSNFFVSICAVALTALTSILIGEDHLNYIVLSFVFCATYFTYNFQRLIRLRSQQLVNKTLGIRLGWMVRYKTTLYFTGLLCGIAALILVFFLDLSSILAIIPLGILSFAYVIPIIPHQKEKKEIRNLPFVKIFIIAFVWSVVTVVIPYFNVYNFDSANWSELSVLLVQRFVFIFAITLPFDIRDLKFDKDFDLKTIPAVIGENNTVLLSIFLMLVFVGTEFFQFYVMQQITFYQFLAFSITSFITIIIISFSSKKRPELFFSFLVEGTMLTQYFGLLILEY